MSIYTLLYTYRAKYKITFTLIFYNNKILQKRILNLRITEQKPLLISDIMLNEPAGVMTVSSGRKRKGGGEVVVKVTRLPC